MKTSILYLTLLMLNCYPAFTQEIINNPEMPGNEAIQQISAPGIDDILSFQTNNQGFSNSVYTQQTGHHNTAIVSQQKEAGPESGNQSHTTQSGNFNELTIGQVGSGNLMLGFQLGYVSTLIGSLPGNSPGIEFNNAAPETLPEGSGETNEGERNKMSITQVGNNNGVMAIQQGADNTISAEQTGSNNYLLAMQKGTRNTITGYKQANESEQILFDRIIQVGDDLSLKADGASAYQPTANTFMQTGNNLSVEVNSDLLNTPGGVEINQTGSDMKVVVNQSYFSFPMK